MIRYGVVHHPARADLLANFAGLDAVVYEDPFPWGNRPNAWRTYRHALEGFPDDADHLVLMQDDAMPVEGFQAAVERAVRAEPDSPIVLFVSQQAIRNSRLLLAACAEDRAFFTLADRNWIPVVAMIWPRRHAGDFLAWADANGFPGERHRADDAIVGKWAAASNTTIIGTVPCLVEHPDEVESLLGLRHRIPRRAICLAGHGDDFQPDPPQG